LVPFLILVAIALLGIVYVTRFSKERSGNWIQFFAKGKEAGFTIKDMEQLRRLVAGSNIRDPANIFNSQKQFEAVVRTVVNAVRLSGERNDANTQYFLSKLFDHFKKMEMEAAEHKSKIANSRQITEGQALRILVAGQGVYKSEVVKNIGNYLTIARPMNSKNAASMQWNGVKVSIYFWREDDAGYVFDSEVIDEVFSKGISSLKVEHNDSLFRTQKRKSLRVKFHKPAFLYLINDGDNPHRLEKTAGLRCMMEDISDTGCAIRVMGQATVGLRLKVQFSLDKIPICIPATVRSIEYNQVGNISLVRMEADPLPIGTRNSILCEVFDMLPEEDEDELPFRVLEEEADAVSSQQANQKEDQNVPVPEEAGNV